MNKPQRILKTFPKHTVYVLYTILWRFLYENKTPSLHYLLALKRRNLIGNDGKLTQSGKYLAKCHEQEFRAMEYVKPTRAPMTDEHKEKLRLSRMKKNVD